MKWEYAFTKEQSLIPITDKGHKDYVVDAGVGYLMDVETVKKIDRSKSTHLGNKLYTEMDKHFHFDWRYVVRKYADHDIAVFQPVWEMAIIKLISGLMQMASLAVC